MAATSFPKPGHPLISTLKSAGFQRALPSPAYLRRHPSSHRHPRQRRKSRAGYCHRARPSWEAGDSASPVRSFVLEFLHTAQSPQATRLTRRLPSSYGGIPASEAIIPALYSQNGASPAGIIHHIYLTRWLIPKNAIRTRPSSANTDFLSHVDVCTKRRWHCRGKKKCPRRLLQ